VLNARGPEPLHSQVAEHLRGQISSGELQPNDMLPSEQELSRHFGVARMTARHGVSHLVNEGLLYRVPGRGTFVAEPKFVSAALGLSGIRAQLHRAGYAAQTSLLVAEVQGATKAVAAHLGLTPGDPVYVIRRLRSANGVPIAVDTSYLSVALFPGLLRHQLADQSLYTVLQDEYGVVPKRAREILEVTLSRPDHVHLAGVDARTPFFRLEIDMFTAYDSCFEYVELHIRGDRVRLRVDVNSNSLVVVPEATNPERRHSAHRLSVSRTRS
jgi:GntR family transcriptional regulator